MGRFLICQLRAEAGYVAAQLRSAIPLPGRDSEGTVKSTGNQISHVEKGIV